MALGLKHGGQAIHGPEGHPDTWERLVMAPGAPHPTCGSSMPYPRWGRWGFSRPRLFLTLAPHRTPHHATPGIRGFPLFMGCLCPWAALAPGRFGLLGAYAGLTVH